MAKMEYKTIICPVANFGDQSLVYGPFGQSITFTVTLDFCPRPARKETNVPLHKIS